ncbi:MAG TPA: DUF1501 domain-containing protein [Pirellulaceae bacterium]|nr:DUF1501 domain-containing protein [Pirellulaceae bacterium]
MHAESSHTDSTHADRSHDQPSRGQALRGEKSRGNSSPDDASCPRPEHAWSRRQLLGALAGVAGGAVASGAIGTGAIGTGGFDTLLRPAVAEQLKSKQKQVLLIWLDGGISQLESWDPKPDSEFGGPFRAIPTSVPGVHFSELLPNTAKQAHQLAIVRSMSTKDENHSTGVPRVLRGDPKNRGVDYPYLGAAVAKLAGQPDSSLPPYVWVKPGRGGYLWQHAGFLGAKYGALALGDGKPPIHIHRPDSIGETDDETRQQLRIAANQRFRKGRREAEVDAYEYSFDVARRLMQRKELFDDKTLDPRDVERYGRHPLGRHLLQARRLIEAGVLFVQVTSYHWDTHSDNFNMHLQLVPQIDRPFAALIEDLSQRGLLDNTLVVLMSEFGRTPKINQRLGRDHWPEAWSLALAGCGVKRGIVVGKTTPNGAFCDAPEYDVGHLFHTIFRAIGIDSKKIEYDNHGQPLPIAHDDCTAITELLA